MFLKQTNSSLNQEHASMSDNAKAAGISPEAAPSAAQITSERRKVKCVRHQPLELTTYCLVVVWTATIRQLNGAKA